MNTLDLNHIASLVVELQQGNHLAFSDLYLLSYSRIYNYAYHYLKDSYLAQDAVQEIFISIYKNIKQLKNPKLFIAWTNQIAFHICYDLNLKRNQQADCTDINILAAICDDLTNSPELQLQKKEEARYLRSCIEQLVPSERDVIKLRYFNNMKLTDIALALNISLSSVKRHLNSAQTSLAESLHDLQ